MAAKQLAWRETSRNTVERTAAIVGPSSAATLALRAADQALAEGATDIGFAYFGTQLVVFDRSRLDAAVVSAPDAP